MPRKAWMRCIIVSAIFALIAPLISSVILAPGSGEVVPVIEAIDADQLSDMTPDEFADRMDTIPMKRLSGVERFTYQFSHPQYWRFYLRGIFASFVLLFPATTIVSYLSQRSHSQP